MTNKESEIKELEKQIRNGVMGALVSALELNSIESGAIAPPVLQINLKERIKSAIEQLIIIKYSFHYGSPTVNSIDEVIATLEGRKL